MDKQIVIAGFPITDEMSLKNHGQHFDIRYEVSNHGRNRQHSMRSDGEQGTYCYYVTIDEQMLPAEQFEEFWLPKAGSFTKRGKWEFASYDYYGPRWSNFHWHGGVTFYSKIAGFDGDPRAVKIGCDFAHAWDDGHWFDYERVEREAKQTIDELRQMYQFNRRCGYSGAWLPEAEMVEKDGKLFTPAAIESMAKYAAERAAKETSAV